MKTHISRGLATDAPAPLSLATGPQRNAARPVRKSQRGQGLVEFSLVLPILLLLTLGTILLALSYIQKARINGLAYMGARVATVRRANFDAADFTLKKYAERSGQNWLSEVTATVPGSSADKVAIRLSKPGERLDVLANLISGQNTNQPLDLIVEMQLPREYTGTGSLRPATFTQVDYHYKPHGLGDLLTLIPKVLLDTTQLVDESKPDNFGERDQNLGLEPSNQNLEKYYAHRGWQKAYSQNDEDPKSSDFAGMQTVYANFKAIETGGMLLQLFIDFLAGVAKPLTDALGTVGVEAAQKAEQGAHSLGQRVDENIRSSFRSGGGL